MRRSPVTIAFVAVIVFMVGLATMSSSAAQPEPPTEVSPTTHAALPTIVPATLAPSADCDAQIEPWPDRPADGWLDIDSQAESGRLGEVGERVAPGMLGDVLGGYVSSALDSGEARQLDRSLATVCLRPPRGTPQGWIVETRRASATNPAGEQVQLAVSQLLESLSLFNFPFVGETEQLTLPNGAEVFVADGGHRVEVLLAYPSGRVVWALAEGVDAPVYGGWPVTFAPLPNPPEPQASPLSTDELIGLALLAGRTTDCGRAPIRANVVVGNSRLLEGTPGRDYICAGNGGNIIKGYAGNDILAGRGSIDVLIGGRGNDRLFGGRADDTLIGGSGRDRLRGGADEDRCTDPVHARNCEIDLGHTLDD